MFGLKARTTADKLRAYVSWCRSLAGASIIHSYSGSVPKCGGGERISRIPRYMKATDDGLLLRGSLLTGRGRVLRGDLAIWKRRTDFAPTQYWLLRSRGIVWRLLSLRLIIAVAGFGVRNFCLWSNTDCWTWDLGLACADILVYLM